MHHVHKTKLFNLLLHVPENTNTRYACNEWTMWKHEPTFCRLVFVLGVLLPELAGGEPTQTVREYTLDFTKMIQQHEPNRRSNLCHCPNIWGRHGLKSYCRHSNGRLSFTFTFTCMPNTTQIWAILWILHLEKCYWCDDVIWHHNAVPKGEVGEVGGEDAVLLLLAGVEMKVCVVPNCEGVLGGRERWGLEEGSSDTLSMSCFTIRDSSTSCRETSLHWTQQYIIDHTDPPIQAD